MPNFLWPTRLNPAPGLRGWLGRMAHYAAMIVACFFVAPVGFNAALSSSSDANRAAIILAGAFGATALLLAGRYVRYRLARE
jgi:hypothetical protein